MSCMTAEQYESLRNIEIIEPSISVSDLTDKTPRTLALGYDCDRNSVHTYLGEDGLIHKFIYRDDVLFHEAKESFPVDEFHPGKRTVPNKTDFEFASLVVKRGGNLCFTTYTPDTPDCAFHGALHNLFEKYVPLSNEIQTIFRGSAYCDREFSRYITVLFACYSHLICAQRLPIILDFTKDDKKTYHLEDLKSMLINVHSLEMNEESLARKDGFIRGLTEAISAFECQSQHD